MGFFIFMVVAGVVVYNLLKNAKVKQEQWRIAAERLGLDYHSADFGLSGTISGRKGGHRIVISTFSKSSGNNNTYTKYHISYHERIPVDFKITKLNALHKMGHAFGLQDIKTENPSFDDRVLVRGRHPQKVREFLTPDRQRVITDLIISHTDIVISNDMIELSKPGKETDAGTLIRTANLLLAVCNDLTDRTASIAEEAEHIVEIEPIEPSLNPFTSANPIVPDPPMVEVEDEPVDADEVVEPPPPAADSSEPADTANSLVEEGHSIELDEKPSPAPVLEVEPVVPADEEAPSSMIEKEVPEAAAAEANDDPAEPEPPSREEVDLKLIAEELYGIDSAGALKASSVFRDSYENAPVSGSGQLKWVSRFSYDPVFKDTVGAKATIEICEIAGPYSTITVKADVAFPPEKYDELKEKIGSTFSVTGKLIAQNAMLQQLSIIAD